MYNPDDYILYIAQCANFQSRIMLIPIIEFLKVRSDDYDMLKNLSLKDQNFTLDNKKYIVDNLLVIDYVNDDDTYRVFSQTDSSYRLLCNHLTSYAEGMDEDCYFHEKDELWYKSAIIFLTTGFNHIYNHKRFKQMTNYKNKTINVVDSFLVLESQNNKYSTKY